MATVNVPIEMNEDLRDRMAVLCDELGLDMETAMNIFARKMVNEQSMPFEVTENDLPVDEEKERRKKIFRIVGIVAAVSALILIITETCALIRTLKERRRYF